ncbi:unnamed protein product, partial [Brassica rapa subsp. trilocularis]
MRGVDDPVSPRTLRTGGSLLRSNDMFRTEMRARVRGNELIRTFKHIIHDYRGYIKAVLFI